MARTKLRVVADNTPKKKSRKPDEPAAEWVSPKLLKPWPRNPRVNDHVVSHVLDSIIAFGFGRPIVARRANYEIIAGHTTWKASMQGELEFVPVRFLDISEEKAHQLALADNKLGEMAEWDTSLVTMLKEINSADIGRLGWTEEELKKVEAAINPPPDEPAFEDDVPPPPKVAVVQPGELWILGKHRLLCADSSVSTNAAIACGDLHPFICITDPPFAENDETFYGPGSLKHFKGDVAYVWTSAMQLGSANVALQMMKLECRSLIVWKKPSPVISRGNYHWQHETCWYSVRKGMNPRWAGGRKQTTVWDIAGLEQDSPGDERTGISAQKPVGIYYQALRNHGKEGDVLYDPFVGSGTAFVAAEQLQRRCVGIEINPAYCDLIIDRWQRMTGGRAKRKAM